MRRTQSPQKTAQKYLTKILKSEKKIEARNKQEKCIRSFFNRKGYLPHKINALLGTKGESRFAAIQLLINNFDSLKEAGFETEHILKIFSRGSVFKNLASVIKHKRFLIEECHLEPLEISNIVAHHGGENNLKILEEYWFRLINECQLRPFEIVSMVSYDSGFYNVKAIFDFLALQEKTNFLQSLTPSEIKNIVSHEKGHANLEYLCSKDFKNHQPIFESLKLKKEDILQILSRRYGYLNLIGVARFNNFIRLSKWDPKEICNFFQGKDNGYDKLKGKVALSQPDVILKEAAALQSLSIFSQQVGKTSILPELHEISDCHP